MWSSVGSTGAIDVGDIGKVIFSGSVVQLGDGAGGVVVNHSTAAQAILLPQVTATIRYEVAPADINGTALGNWKLQMRYRSGNGRVTATLTEVALGGATVPPVIGPVVETSLLTVGSTVPSGDAFVTYNLALDPISPNFRHVLNFNNNAYYVVVTLSGEGLVVGHPPAISSVGLFPR